MPKNRKTNSNAETGLSLAPSRKGATTKRQGPAPGEPWNETRAEMVERARKLVGDANYPPAEVMRQVADLLAQHINGLRR